MKKIFSLILFIVSATSLNAQITTLISPTGDGGFETGTTFSANGWTEVNTAPLQTNQWFLGTAVAGFTGARCAYVGTAATNNNYNSNIASVVHLYRDVVFPAGQNLIRLNFRWKSRGRANEDIMKIYLVPSTYTPLAGVLPPAVYLIGDDYRNNTTWVNDSIDLDCALSGSSQRLVFTWVNDAANGNNPAIALDNIKLITDGVTDCMNALGLGVYGVGSLPYNSGPGTTCGKDDDVDDLNAPVCGDPNYVSDEDVVWVFTPTSTGQMSIDLNAPAANATGLQLFDGCPFGSCNGVQAVCVAYVQDPGGSKSICVGVQAGHTYFLVLDGDGECNAYDNLYLSGVTAVLPGTTCANPITIGTLPASFLNESTACMNDDYNSSTTGGCSSIYMSGEDKVYMYNSLGGECIGITLSNVSTPNIGFQVYYGCPGSGGTCITSYGGNSVVVGSLTLANPGTYYIIVDSWAPPSSVGYDLFITSFGAGAPNDLPCNAQLLQNGVYTLGNNNCSSGAGEPVSPACWQNTAMNSVWFKAVVGAAGTAFIQTQTLTLTDTQLEVFRGTCGALTAVPDGCNNNGIAGCNGITAASSLTLTGLTPGETLFIRVDGVFDLTGTFNIIFSDAPLTAGFNQQDCLGAINVCSPVISQPTSFFGCGLIGEIPPPGNISNPAANVSSGNSGCLLAAELNIVWYIINVSSNGTLKWTHNHPTGFYDWILYDLTNNSCSDISNNLLPPVRCNWNGAASTSCGMQNPIPVGASPFNFEAPLAVVAGQKFALALSNYSGTNGGFTLDFSGSTCGFGSSATIAWNGNVNTTWTNTSNWGGCNIPTCGVDANIFPASNQPVIAANTTINSINILAGATLTIQPGVTVNVCGDFNNYGTLIASPTSTIVMNNGSVVQHFTGNFTGSNKLGNVTLSKVNGTAIANDDLDIAGNFVNSGASSIFDMNNKYIRLSGHLQNSSGNLTIINCGPTGTLEFNGAAVQTYNPGGVLDLNNVIINNTGGGVNLFLHDMHIASTGSLNLMNGKLNTATWKAILKNPDPNSLTGGTSANFVQGTLQRSLNGLANAYNFPIGHSVNGYQRMEVEFTTPTLIPDLTVSFATYPAVPNGPVSNDCFNVDYSSLPVLDNGYWSVLPSSNGTSGNYTMRLYPLNYSSAAAYTSILSSPTTPPLATSWTLNGNCTLGSSAAMTDRVLMNGFGYFGIGQGIPGSLPVELTDFKGQYLPNFNQLSWECLSEKNNDYFTLERSVDMQHFVPIGKVQGAGSTTTVTTYSFKDFSRLSGVNYYRLRQTDFDGTSTLSHTIAVNAKLSESTVEVYPNPASENLNIRLELESALPGSLVVADVSGKIISTIQLTDFQDQVFPLDVRNLEPGCYFLHIYSTENDLIGQTKFVRN